MLVNICVKFREDSLTSFQVIEQTRQMYRYPGRKTIYSKTGLKRPLSKRPKIGIQKRLSLNAGQKYCRMFQGEHSAILLTLIKLPFVFKTFVLSIFE